MGIFSKKKKQQEEPEIESQDVRSKDEIFFEAGVAYFEKGEYKNSQKYFEKAVEANPDNEDAIHNLKVVMQKVILEEKRKRLEKEQNLQEKAKETEARERILNESSGYRVEKVDSTPTKATSSPISTESDKLVEDDYYSILGLPHDASQDEIKDKISEEFKKWRTRVNSPDLKKRYEAEQMMAIISKAKRKLIK